jgi:multiple sugar transport system permease protein
LITVGLIGSIKVFPIALFGNSAIDAQKYGPTMLGYVYKEVKYANYGLAGAASVMVLVLTLFFNVFVRVFMKGLQRSQSMIITKIRTTKIENRTRQIKLEVGDEND